MSGENDIEVTSSADSEKTPEQLPEGIDLKESHINTEQEEILKDLLVRNRDLFSKK